MRKKLVLETTKISDLDKQLQELAVLDFQKFCRITNIDKVQVFICLERKKGRSMQYIANKAKMAKSTVINRCKKCEE